MRVAILILLALATTAQARPFTFGIGQRDQLTKGLVAYWAMRNSGTTVYDEWGAYSGTAVNGPVFSYANGLVASGVYFDGVNDYVALGANTFDALYSAGRVTVALWFNVPVGIDTSVEHLFFDMEGWYAFGHSQPGSAGKPYVFFTGTGSSRVEANINIIDGTWHHLVGVYNGTSQIIYLDGVLRASANVALGNIAGGTANNYIGARYNLVTAVMLKGSVDEARVYNVALSAEEIKQLYRMGWTIYNNR
jgi:hypothetical protein